jgi:hypothetical protein
LHDGVSLPIAPPPRNRHDRWLLSRPVGPLLDAHPLTLHYAARKRKRHARNET